MKILSLLLLLLPTTATLAYRPVDFPCRAPFQCESGFCNEKRQCELKRGNGAACSSHDGCTSGRCNAGVCQVQFGLGSGPCAAHEDCQEGWCNAANLCEALKPRKESCVDDFECRSGRCTNNPRECEFVIYENAICGKNNDCDGDRCKFIHQGGDNRCYPRKKNFDRCNHNSDCLSLRCETQNCTEPVWLGEPCDEPSDCYSLFCNSEKGCVATAGEADNNEIEPEAPGITGSEAQSQAWGGGGESFIGGSETFVGNGSNNSGGMSEMKRVGIAAVVGLVGAAVAMMV